MQDAVLVHLAAGLGNIILATPLLVALGRLGFVVDLWLSADYPESSDLFHGWAGVRALVDGPHGDYAARVPAVPPFYWAAFASRYAGLEGVITRPPARMFWTDEQAYYLEFARALGYAGAAPRPFLPVPTAEPSRASTTTVVLAPGCKTGNMAAKRWPWFPELAARFEDVVVVGMPDDLTRFDGRPMIFPRHVRVLAGCLGLRETAQVIAAAGVVVANDSGLGHMAAALGVPTVLLFGPTPDRTLGRMSPHVTVMRAGLPCEPCWFGGRRFDACVSRIDCLAALDVRRVTAVVQRAFSLEGAVSC